MVIEIFKQKNNQFRLLKKSKHDCLYIGFLRYRIRIGNGDWLHAGDGSEKIAPGPQTPPIPKYKNEVA